MVFVAVARVENQPAGLEELLGPQRAERVQGFLANRSPEGAREAAIKDASLLVGFVLIATPAEGLVTNPTTG
ncbi:hypothetical protein N24_0170 [Corynebacterium suranareeae]|uniref:Uncharacterized protein n=1 Tax=Corynebacterium suranareeae TaxID=2506452 RepID=A0A169RMK5_9CORY|nr:hypothetical protein N24_0170 [Corynebacterium suranareeae]